MADPTTTARPPRSNTTTAAATGPTQFLQRLHDRSPTSNHLLGILTLAITGGVLLLFAGLTITSFVLGLIFLSPVVLLTAPLWVPFAVLVFGFLSFCGSGVAALAAASWLYRYFRGMHPPGSDRFDYARSRIADTAREVKDYAREYGGFLHSKVKDAAPGA